MPSSRARSKITNFGALVELEPELEGLLHVSELADQGRHPETLVNVGDELEVRVLRVDIDDRDRTGVVSWKPTIPEDTGGEALHRRDRKSRSRAASVAAAAVC